MHWQLKKFAMTTSGLISVPYFSWKIKYSSVITPFLNLTLGKGRPNAEAVVQRCVEKKKFAKFKGKHMFGSIIFNIAAGLELQICSKEIVAKVPCFFSFSFFVFFLPFFSKTNFHWNAITYNNLNKSIKIKKLRFVHYHSKIMINICWKTIWLLESIQFDEYAAKHQIVIKE